MVFNSFQFLWLFPLIWMAVVVLRYSLSCRVVLCTKVENFLLIAISYYLYMQWEPKYVLVLLGVTAITYTSALLIEKHNAYGKKKYLVFTGATIALIPLLVFKYTGFVLGTLKIFTGGGNFVEIHLIAPLGISFFTFQAVGYLFDVYYKRTKAEHNWWDYMLFVCFFPQILSGPISKADELLPQIKSNRTFKYGQVTRGLKWLLWGMFLKVVFADRIGIYVDTIYNNYTHMSGLSCTIGAVLYSLQIYGDFAGYSFMSVGVGQLMGFELINNFQRPYLAHSISEFWKRWHVSLTRWLTQNVYIPMGGSRCSRFRQYLNIMVTFMVSGVWHGANWTFIFWGGLHGALQIVEKFMGLDPKGKFLGGMFKKVSDGHTLQIILKPIRVVVTFLMVTFAWIFFRMPTINGAFVFVDKIFTDHSNTIAEITPSAKIYIMIGLAVGLVKDLMDEYCKPEHTILHNKYAVVRWLGYIGLTYLIMMCGVFDAGSFIYVNF